MTMVPGILWQSADSSDLMLPLIGGLVLIGLGAIAIVWMRRKSQTTFGLDSPVTVTETALDPLRLEAEARTQDLAQIQDGELPHLFPLLHARLDLDDLEEFDLIDDFSAHCDRVRAGAQARTPIELCDGTIAGALEEAIERLDEADVPREVSGQRLAAVITKCREALDWDELPVSRAAAVAFLESRGIRVVPPTPK